MAYRCRVAPARRVGRAASLRPPGPRVHLGRPALGPDCLLMRPRRRNAAPIKWGVTSPAGPEVAIAETVEPAADAVAPQIVDDGGGLHALAGYVPHAHPKVMRAQLRAARELEIDARRRLMAARRADLDAARAERRRSPYLPARGQPGVRRAGPGGRSASLPTGPPARCWPAPTRSWPKKGWARPAF